MSCKLRSGAENLRGRRVRFRHDGRTRRGTVITHLRDGLWRISFYIGLEYRRITLHRDLFVVLEPKR